MFCCTSPETDLYNLKIEKYTDIKRLDDQFRTYFNSLLETDSLV